MPVVRMTHQLQPLPSELNHGGWTHDICRVAAQPVVPVARGLLRCYEFVIEWAPRDSNPDLQRIKSPARYQLR